MSIMIKTKNTQRWWDFPAVLLMSAALFTAATRLVATRWTSHLDIVQTLTVLGLLLGIALGYSRFSGRTALILSIMYGCLLITWQLGTTLNDEMLWLERISVLTNRSMVVVDQVIKFELVQDSILFLILMSILFWGLSIFAAYLLIRYGNAWFAILPAGIVLLVIHTFDSRVERRVWYLAFFLFVSLITVTRIVFLHYRKQWETNRTALPPHLSIEFVRIAFFASALILMLAWTMPALANSLSIIENNWQPVKEFWNITKDKFDNLFASLNSTTGLFNDFYGKSAVLGRGNPLSDIQIFIAIPPDNLPEDYRIYWHARNYDFYQDGQWNSTHDQTSSYNPALPELAFENEENRLKRTFEFIASTPMTTLLTPTQPIWVSRDSLVEYHLQPDGYADISTIRASPKLEPGQGYKSQGYLGYVSIKELRNSGTDYPAWITDRYLQLPDNITLQTKLLAEKISADFNNPYDKTVAITNFLRENIQYTETIPEPPQHKEIIDWILFDLKQGFCNYYATAEIIMLRSLGIPARFAIGYAQGEQTEDSKFIVKQGNAHAWPEVYFPKIGWVEFEPTASQPNILRPLVNPLLDKESNQFAGSDFIDPSPKKLDDDNLNYRGVLDFSNGQKNELNWRKLLAVLTILGVITIFIFLLWQIIKRINFPPIPVLLCLTLEKAGVRSPKTIQKWAYLASLPPITKAYLEINNALNRIGETPSLSDTPNERAANLGHYLPNTKQPAHQLVIEYEIDTFALKNADLQIAQKASSFIRNYSIKVYLTHLLDRIDLSRRKSSSRLSKNAKKKLDRKDLTKHLKTT